MLVEPGAHTACLNLASAILGVKDPDIYIVFLNLLMQLLHTQVVCF